MVSFRAYRPRGRIPYLLAAGVQGPIVCTEPSAVAAAGAGGRDEDGCYPDARKLEKFIKLIAARIVAVPYGWHRGYRCGRWRRQHYR